MLNCDTIQNREGVLQISKYILAIKYYKCLHILVDWEKTINKYEQTNNTALWTWRYYSAEYRHFWPSCEHHAITVTKSQNYLLKAKHRELCTLCVFIYVWIVSVKNTINIWKIYFRLLNFHELFIKISTRHWEYMNYTCAYHSIKRDIDHFKGKYYLKCRLYNLLNGLTWNEYYIYHYKMSVTHHR